MTDASLVNPEAARADQILKTIEGILVPIAEHAIQAACPALDMPVIKQITDEIVQATSNELTKLAEQGATFLVIDHEVDKEVSGLSDALKSLALAEKGGNPDEIQAAIKVYAAAQGALADDNGGASPQ